MAEDGKTCDVEGCNEPAERSISNKKVEASGLPVPGGKGNVRLCRAHYREMKKRNKRNLPDYVG
ncbi:MAG: hypothetical protein GX224_05955 [Thermoplasmatales archaeon]|nr:hypothetical protein [Thermoplasmatales archaeon]